MADVKLPKTNTPRFPPVCVKCSETPTTSVKISSDAVGWWSWMRVGRFYGQLTGRSFEVPACDTCRRAIRNDRWKRKGAELFFVTLGVIIGMWLFSEWDGVAKKAAVLGIALLVALPWLMFERFYPAAVSITVTEDTVTFHFADEDYAQEFADRNPTL